MTRYNRRTPDMSYEDWLARVCDAASDLCADPHFDALQVTDYATRLHTWQTGIDVERASYHWMMLWYERLAREMILAGDGEDSTPEWFAQARALLCNALRVQVDMLDTKVAEWRASNTPPWAAYWWIAELVALAVE